MSFFVDANVPIYAAGTGRYAEACERILRAVAGGASGRMSTEVLEEVWHVELSGRVEGLAGLAERSLAIFSPLLPVTEDAVRVALAIDAPTIGANDRIHVATCLAAGIEVIVSADVAFDSVAEIRRTDPLDHPALSQFGVY